VLDSSRARAARALELKTSPRAIAERTRDPKQSRAVNHGLLLHLPDQNMDDLGKYEQL